MSLYVRLNAEYPTDDEFIEAGPMAELLYIRALCFCKRKLIDGTVSAKQLPTVAMGIPSPKRHARTLVEVGLWEETSEGWAITGWLKWNKSANQVEEDREARRIASMQANHAQHHVGEGKKPNSRCELCRSGFSDLPPKSAPKSDPPTEPDSLRSRLPKPKPEPEEEPKPEPKPKEEPSIGTSSSSSNLVAPDDDERIEQIIHTAVDIRIQANPPRTNPTSYRRTVEQSVRAEHTERIHELAAMCQPDTPISLLAGAVESGDTRQLASWLRTPDKPEPDPEPTLTREQREALIAANKEQP